MKKIINKFLLVTLLFAMPVFAADGVAVVDVRAAILSTQAAADAFKALEEDADYSSNLEEAQSIEAERQTLAERLQKDVETLSQTEIGELQRDIQEQTKDLEFLVGKLQAAREETAQKLFAEKTPVVQKIISAESKGEAESEFGLSEIEKQDIMNTILEHDTKDLQETSDKIRKDIESKQ